MNSYGLGVGMILLAPRSVGVHDGMQSKADEQGSLARVSGAAERKNNWVTLQEINNGHSRPR
jgi:hypothetical protein